MSDKISQIKGRLLQFMDNQQISKKDFCVKTGISYANMRGKSLFSEIGGEQIAEILSQYREISPDWLITGTGPMLRNNGVINSGNGQQVVANHNNGTINADNRQYYSDSPDVLRTQIDILDERIKEKDAQIKEKDAQIKEKDAQIKEKDAQINKLIELLGKKYESGQ